jgi:hypothetical protein
VGESLEKVGLELTKCILHSERGLLFYIRNMEYNIKANGYGDAGYDLFSKRQIVESVIVRICLSAASLKSGDIANQTGFLANRSPVTLELNLE